MTSFITATRKDAVSQIKSVTHSKRRREAPIASYIYDKCIPSFIFWCGWFMCVLMDADFMIHTKNVRVVYAWVPVCCDGAHAICSTYTDRMWSRANRIPLFYARCEYGEYVKPFIFGVLCIFI